jgi:hypothetical protein
MLVPLRLLKPSLHRAASALSARNRSISISSSSNIASSEQASSTTLALLRAPDHDFEVRTACAVM